MTAPPLSVGVDAASVDRVDDALGGSGSGGGPGSGVTDRVFTAAEIDYCRSRADPPQHFAARWAAKEATVKALPDTDDGAVPLADVAIEREGEGGRPVLALSGAAREAREAFTPGAATSVSLTHDRRAGVAVAVVALAVDSRTARRCVETADVEGALAAVEGDGAAGSTGGADSDTGAGTGAGSDAPPGRGVGTGTGVQDDTPAWGDR